MQSLREPATWWVQVLETRQLLVSESLMANRGFCPDCDQDPGAAVGAWATAKKSKSKSKAKRPPSSPSDSETGVKRKASLKTKAAA